MRKYGEHFKSATEFLAHWDGIKVNTKNVIVQKVVFGYDMHYATYYTSEFWYMTSPDDDTVITALNLPNYVYDIRHAWKVAEKMGIALVPQSDEDTDGFRWLAMDLTRVTFSGTIILQERGASAVSKRLASEAICLSAIISELELS